MSPTTQRFDHSPFRRRKSMSFMRPRNIKVIAFFVRISDGAAGAESAEPLISACPSLMDVRFPGWADYSAADAANRDGLPPAAPASGAAASIKPDRRRVMSQSCKAAFRATPDEPRWRDREPASRRRVQVSPPGTIRLQLAAD